MTEIDMPKNRVGTSGTLGTDLTDIPWVNVHTNLIIRYLSTIIKSDSHSFTPVHTWKKQQIHGDLEHKQEPDRVILRSLDYTKSDLAIEKWS